MLTRLRLRNYKSFLEADIRFQDRHLLIGKNNSGKTSLSRAIVFLRNLADSTFAESIDVVPGGLSELCHWDVKSQSFEIACECSLNLQGVLLDFSYELELEIASSVSQRSPSQLALQLRAETLKVARRGKSSIDLLRSDGVKVRLLPLAIDEIANCESNNFQAKACDDVAAPTDATALSKLYEQPGLEAILAFRDFVSTWTYYSLSPVRMRWPIGERSFGIRSLDADGGNLSDVLFNLKNMNEAAYRRVIEFVREVEPSLVSVLHVPVPNQPPVPFVELTGGRRASWTGLSDGTLRMLALACVAQQAALVSETRANGRMAIIEEPENGIFPGMLRKVSDHFDEWAPLSQFIFTSHSPFFIDMFNHRRHAVTILRKEGGRTDLIQPSETASEDEFTLSEEYAAELML